jgi:AcrR family transcriptional regulator
MTNVEPKPRRAYQSIRRRQQAEETRAAVLEAATRLFGERGWAGTGIRDVARAAEVSVETVYASFGSKGDLLKAAIDVAVVGDDEPVPLDQRAAFAALGGGSREERMRTAAHLVTEIHRRTAGVIVALREAAAADPELYRLMRRLEEGRLGDLQQGMTLVLGHPISQQRSEALWALTSTGVYQMLTDLRHWSTQQYEDWLAGALDALS